MEIVSNIIITGALNMKEMQLKQKKATIAELYQYKKSKKALWKLLKGMHCGYCDANCNEHCVAILKQIKTLEIEIIRGKSKYLNEVDVKAKADKNADMQQILQNAANMQFELEQEREKCVQAEEAKEKAEKQLSKTRADTKSAAKPTNYSTAKPPKISKSQSDREPTLNDYFPGL